ncbi:MAG TPA: biotin/lipoyl-containing protein [Gemmatimonadaceae bacterium]|nr:biotin/lipoyl-containing protein [Gemmatimonadaceae bacterium]
MKYIVRVNGAAHEVVLDGTGVRHGGGEVRAHLEGERAGTPIRLLTLDAEVHGVLARRHPERGRYTLWIDGYRYEVEALDERTRAIRELAVDAEKSSGPAPLVAPMPGLVIRVNVKVGDVVEAGQPLVSIEAMKMENELRSKSAGTVKAVAAVPGTAVEKGSVLVELE